MPERWFKAFSYCDRLQDSGFPLEEAMYRSALQYKIPRKVFEDNYLEYKTKPEDSHGSN